MKNVVGVGVPNKKPRRSGARLCIETATAAPNHALASIGAAEETGAALVPAAGLVLVFVAVFFRFR
jgi:hypothetical protein